MDTFSLSFVLLFFSLGAGAAVIRAKSLDDVPPGPGFEAYVTGSFWLGATLIIVACAQYFKLVNTEASKEFSTLEILLMMTISIWFALSALAAFSFPKRYLYLPLGFVGLFGIVALSSVGFHDTWGDNAPQWATVFITFLAVCIPLHLTVGSAAYWRGKTNGKEPHD